MKRKIIALTVLSLLFVSSASAWQEPGTSFSTLPSWFASPLTGNGTANYLSKYTSSSGLGLSQLFDDGSKVGIGNAAPAYKLDVTGSFRASSDIYSDTINTSASADPLEINYKKAGPTIICASASCATISAYFDTTGNVGIGDNTPSYPLDVNGKANATQLCIAGTCKSSWPAGGDITGVTAGTGLSGGGTNGTVTLNLTTPVAVANGGTGVTTKTGTGSVVLSASPTLTGNVDLQQGTLKFGAGNFGKIYPDPNGGGVSIDNLIVTSVLNIKDSSLSVSGAYGNLAIDGNDPTRSLDASLSIRTSDKFDYANTTAVGATQLCHGLNGSYQQIGNCTSLLKYKTNIQNLPIGLDTLLKLRPVSFDWKDPNMGGHDLGFIAEEVQAVDPLLAEYTNGKLSGVKYSQMSSLLVKSIQDLKGQVDQLKAQNADLEKRLEALEAKVK